MGQLLFLRALRSLSISFQVEHPHMLLKVKYHLWCFLTSYLGSGSVHFIRKINLYFLGLSAIPNNEFIRKIKDSLIPWETVLSQVRCRALKGHSALSAASIDPIAAELSLKPVRFYRWFFASLLSLLIKIPETSYWLTLELQSHIYIFLVYIPVLLCVATIPFIRPLFW